MVDADARLDERMTGRQDQEIQRGRGEIENLLRPHGWIQHDRSAERGFEASRDRIEDPYLIGGFYYDGGEWDRARGKFAAVLAAHGYRVEMMDYFGPKTLKVWPPPTRPGWFARWRQSRTRR